MSGYTVMSSGGSTCRFLKWIIEGSNSGEEGSWTVMDRRKTERMNVSPVTRYFSCSSTNQPYRFIKITQLGMNDSVLSEYRYCLKLQRIEFFGDLLKKL